MQGLPARLALPEIFRHLGPSSESTTGLQLDMGHQASTLDTAVQVRGRQGKKEPKGQESLVGEFGRSD